MILFVLVGCKSNDDSIIEELPDSNVSNVDMRGLPEDEFTLEEIPEFIFYADTLAREVDNNIGGRYILS